MSEQIHEGNQLRIIKENQKRIQASKPKQRKGMSEDALQQLCYMWFHNSYPQYRGLLFHVPNGGSRNAIEGKKFKQIGVVAGVADLLFLFNGKCYCLELKTQIGRQSKKQQDWQDLVERNGMTYVVIRDLITFQSNIKNIIAQYI